MSEARKTVASAVTEAPAGGTPSAGAALPLTRRKTGKTLGGMFLPYQVDWINDDAPRKLGDKSRRTGWTYCEAYDCVALRYRKTGRRAMDYWFSSADESAAQEFIDYCRFFARDLFGVVADQFVEQVEDSETKRLGTAFCIRTPSGHKIVAMSSNPRRFRSKGGDVCLDEIAFHDDARGMYTAASPVTTWGGSLRMFSTPNGEGSEFNRFVQICRKVLIALGYNPDKPRECPLTFGQINEQARRLKLTPYFSYHRVTIEDAIEQGIVELINRTRGTNWTREEFLQDCKDKSLDWTAFLQEYMCIASADASAWLSYALIESCESEEAAQPGAGLIGYKGGPCYIGVDFARDRDRSVVWVLEAVGDVLWTRQIEYLDNLPTPDQADKLAAILRSVQFNACEMDMTGNGLGLFEYTRKAFGPRVHGVNFASSVKASPLDEKSASVPVTESIATALKTRMEDRMIRLPWNCTEVRDDLHKPKRMFTATGRVTFVATRDKQGHADRFWALSLAVGGATVKSSGIIEPLGMELKSPLAKWEGLP